MNNFEQTLLRLKEQLGLQTDREVAEELGLTVKAFTARKMRGAFPVDKLLALKLRREKLNVDYVLSGNPAALMLESIRDAQVEFRREQAEYGIKEDDLNGYRSRKVQLVENFEMLDEQGKQAVEAMISALLTKK